MFAIAIFILSRITPLIYAFNFNQINFSEFENFPNYVAYYEPFRISNVDYHSAESYPQRIEFTAFQTHFVLFIQKGSQILPADSNIFAQNRKHLQTLDPNQILNYIIEGTVKDDPESYVHGTFRNGTFDGVIHTSNETFYVDDTDRFFMDSLSTPFNSIIYRASDLNLTRWQCPDDLDCNETMLVRYLHGPHVNASLPIKRFRTRASKVVEGHLVDYLPPELPDDIFVDRPSYKHRARKRPVCLLSVIADHNFFQSVGRRNFRRTTEEIIYLVSEANRLYQKEDFDGDRKKGDIELQIKSLFIHKSTEEANYILFNEKLSAEEYLQKLTEYDFDGYCLGLAFTSRSFPKRVLGLAFIADPNRFGTLGGICQERRYLTFRRQSMSYNAAFITVANKGRRLPRLMNVLTLAHELGHSFGSHHDPKDEESPCSSSKADDGDFIMAENAVSGKQRNNYQFSQCSINYIRRVLSTKSFCFTDKRPVCGNGIAEVFEECDCGHPLQCAETDKCCTPLGGIGKDAECTYRRQEGSQCSPKKDQCCKSNCKIVPEESHQLCSEVTNCREDSYCDGISSQCPLTPPRQDFVPCLGRTGLCLNGDCHVRICALNPHFTECDCLTPEFMCHKCCRRNGSSCRPASSFGIKDIYGLPVLQPNGAPCDNGRGFCNILGDCVEPYQYQRDASYTTTDTDETETERSTSPNETVLMTLLIVLLVFLSFGLIVCMAIFFTPLIKVIQQTPDDPNCTTIVMNQPWPRY